MTGVKAGNVAQILVEWKSVNTASWGSGDFGVLPAGWRPLITTRWAYSGRDGGTQRDFTILPDGKFTYRNLGGSQNGTFRHIRLVHHGLNRRHRKRYAAGMPCVCWNGRIIRCAEGNRVSRNVQKTILHMVFIGIVYELVEAFIDGLHVHAC